MEVYVNVVVCVRARAFARACVHARVCIYVIFTCMRM